MFYLTKSEKENLKKAVNKAVCGVLYTIVGTLGCFVVASIVAMLINCF